MENKKQDNGKAVREDIIVENAKERQKRGAYQSRYVILGIILSVIYAIGLVILIAMFTKTYKIEDIEIVIPLEYKIITIFLYLLSVIVSLITIFALSGVRSRMNIAEEKIYLNK